MRTSRGTPSSGAPETDTDWELVESPSAMMQMNDDFFSPEVPPHWVMCLAAADSDGITAKARELGASVTVEPMDMPIGRFADMIDPQGAFFTLMQPAPPA